MTRSARNAAFHRRSKGDILEQIKRLPGGIEAFYVELLGPLDAARSAAWRRTTCPFAPSSGKAFNVNVEHGGWRCHGCESSGDVFSFWSRRSGIEVGRAAFPVVLGGMAGFPEALEVREVEVTHQKPKDVPPPPAAATQSEGLADRIFRGLTDFVPFPIEAILRIEPSDPETVRETLDQLARSGRVEVEDRGGRLFWRQAAATPRWRRS